VKNNYRNIPKAGNLHLLGSLALLGIEAAGAAAEAIAEMPTRRAILREYQRLNGYSDEYMAQWKPDVATLGELGQPEYASPHRTRLTTPGRDAVYHISSRLAGDLPLWREEERGMFRQQLELVAEYCGVVVLNYSILDNHFHLLVRVPERAAREKISSDHLLRRIGLLHSAMGLAESLAKAVGGDQGMSVAGSAAGHFSPQQLHRGVRMTLEESAAGWARREMERHRGLMCDLGAFVRILKQRFSRWFNGTHERFGTLWADRFRSMLVEESSEAIQAISAYIDLNAVRRGWVTDPSDYPFCGAGEARQKAGMARRGIREVVGKKPLPQESGTDDALDSWEEIAEQHRSLLWGDLILTTEGDTKRGKPCCYAELPLRHLRETVLADLVGGRHAVLLDSLALGSRGFVEQVYRGNRALAGGTGTLKCDWLHLSTRRGGLLQHWLVQGLVLMRRPRMS
jgi:hypothetical protein